MTDVYIISGFLGAGKTTLIKKLLEEEFKQKKVVLIENDFGEISVDAVLLREKDIKVTEISAGCICCSVAGNFAAALTEIAQEYDASCIIIEPSGVGKLSDISSICERPKLRNLVKIRRKITVVDAARFEKYMRNYGEFFIDQIKNADTIVFSHMEEVKHNNRDLENQVRKLAKQAVVFSEDLEQLSAKRILNDKKDMPGVMTPIRRQCHCGCNGHCHHAEDVFDTVTLRTREQFVHNELERRLSNLLTHTKGEVLRAKGIVKGEKGYLQVQYLPGEMKITECEKSGDMICVIGHKLNPSELQSLFLMR